MFSRERILYSEAVNRILIRDRHNSAMADSSVIKSMRLGRRDAAWLVIAMLVHCSLLLLPLHHRTSEPASTQVLSVSLLKPQVREALPEPPLPEMTVREESPPLQSIPPRETARIPAAPTPDPVQDDIEEPRTRTSTARLVDSANQMKWSLSEKPADRKLGVHVPQEIPDNWLPLIVVEDNRFNGMTIPATTEVVDRWLAADGSHNVVINTPTGETLCGRAQAWNPMNPLVETLMMFGKCGGGGARKFKMPDRFMRHLVD